MKKTGQKRKRITHKEVQLAVQGISRNLRCGNTNKAKRYTMKLLVYLDHLDLLPGRLLCDSCGQGIDVPTCTDCNGTNDTKEGIVKKNLLTS